MCQPSITKICLKIACVNFIQSNLNQHSIIFIKENALENVVCKVSSIFSRPQCVNASYADPKTSRTTLFSWDDLVSSLRKTNNVRHHHLRTHLTFKQIDIFIQNVIFSLILILIKLIYLNLVQHNEYLASTVDIDGLVL